MTKPKAIQWLERETGERIVYPRPPSHGQDRHLSVRLPEPLARHLNELASARRHSVSQTLRELIESAVNERDAIERLDDRALAARLEADVAEVRRRLAG